MNSRTNLIETVGPYVRAKQVYGPGGILPIGRSSFYALVAKGLLPRPSKVGRISFWVRDDLLAAFGKIAR